MPTFPTRTALTLVTFAVFLLAASRLAPAIKLPDVTTAANILEFTTLSPLQKHTALEVIAMPTVRLDPANFHPILDDRGGVLDHFYAALWRTERGKTSAVTRILHYGDSPTTADLITGDTRQLLQQRFGDAGHGFTLIGKPWAWYQHRGIELASHGWEMEPGTRWDMRNQMFGLGGVIFSSHSEAFSRVTLRDPTESSLEVWFLRQPNGGTVSVSAEDQPVSTIATDAPFRTPGFARFDLPSGVRTLDFRSHGDVTLYGITLEKAHDGVVYDSIGLNGASVSMPALLFNEQHWAEELRHRNPDLLVLNYGTNESSFAAFLTHEYEKELREAIRRVRAALPDTSILVMSPMDRGSRDDGEIETLPTIPRIVEIQRRVADELHCGFFNTFEVMGGDGTMGRWYEARPALVSADLIHPTPAGAHLIAAAFVKEINVGLNRYKLHRQLRASP